MFYIAFFGERNTNGPCLTQLIHKRSFFAVAFIFNWIGFLLLMCFCHTIASRYGALSGFGLSLAKWTFIVQHSTELASKDNSWLWWLIMTFGKQRHCQIVVTALVKEYRKELINLSFVYIFF